MKSFAHCRQALAGWVYPPLCAACEDPLESERQLERPFLCESCEATLTRIEGNVCRICGQAYDSPVTPVFQCANCGDRELAIDFAVSAWRSDGVARELMHQYKYGRRLHLSRLMGSLLRPVWEDARLREVSRWYLVPVPLHRRRRRERGFNQAREIAREFSRHAPPSARLTLFPALKRVRHTVRQARLDRKERLVNPSGIFALRRRLRESLPDDAGILIVDDVITTGSTVSECAAVLRQRYEHVPVAAVSVMRG